MDPIGLVSFFFQAVGIISSYRLNRIMSPKYRGGGASMHLFRHFVLMGLKSPSKMNIDYSALFEKYLKMDDVEWSYILAVETTDISSGNHSSTFHFFPGKETLDGYTRVHC